MRRILVATIPLVVGSLVISGCSASAKSGSLNGGPAQYATNGSFAWAIPGDPGTWDPYQTVWPLNSLAYDSLVNMLPDGKLTSGLAEKWTADAHSASFTLRPGITCSDGTALTASQAADAINYVGDYKNHPNYAYGFYTPDTPFRASADDASRTVMVTMTGDPFGFLLNTVGQLPIVCAKGLKNPKMLQRSTDGTGPFVLADVEPGQSYTFTVRNGYTWGYGGASTNAPGTPARVIIKVIQNETTAANLLLSGQLNLAQITGPDQQRLNAAGLSKVDYPTPGADVAFNQAPGRATRDKRVREALIQALDFDQIVKVSTGGSGTAAKSLRAFTFAACRDDILTEGLPKHDVAAAEKLLDQAGWIKDSGGVRRKDGQPLKLDLVTNAGPGYSLNAPTTELMAQEWRAIGVDVNTPSYSTAAALYS